MFSLIWKSSTNKHDPGKDAQHSLCDYATHGKGTIDNLEKSHLC